MTNENGAIIDLVSAVNLLLLDNDNRPANTKFSNENVCKAKQALKRLDESL